MALKGCVQYMPEGQQWGYSYLVSIWDNGAMSESIADDMWVAYGADVSITTSILLCVPAIMDDFGNLVILAHKAKGSERYHWFS